MQGNIADIVRINEKIRAEAVRLIGPDGEQVGIVSVPEALSYADRLNLDLVEVAPMASPPVCKVMDYGKYRYEQEQKAKEARKRQTTISIKEIKLRPKIDDHDFDTKKGHVERFLKKGDKVKLTIMFRGRELVHPHLGETTAPAYGGGSGRDRRGRVGAEPRRQEHDHDAGAQAELIRRLVLQRPLRNRPQPSSGRAMLARMWMKGTGMAKNKTHKGTKKRIRVTATGKLMRQRAFGSHLLTKKSANRKRKLRKAAQIVASDTNRLRSLLGR